MRAPVALALAAALVAAGPASAGTIRPLDRPVPVTASSSGPVGGSLGSAASTGSGALMLVGILTLVAVGVVVAATD